MSQNISSLTKFWIALRSAVFFAQMTIALVCVFAPLVLISFPFSFKVRYAFGSGWAKWVIFSLGWICGLKYQVSGRENITDKNAIIFCKHQSAWETFALQAIFPPQCWVLKKELLRIPFFGWALALLDPIAIDRSRKSQSFKQIISQGTDRLKTGRWVVIFPEGTRTAPGEKQPYLPGGAMLAEKSGYPIIPVAHNAGYFWGRRGFMKYPGTIQVRIGPAMYCQGMKTRDINDRASAWIESQMEQINTSN